MRYLTPILLLALVASLPAQVVNSSHDLRGYIPGLNRVCQPCHTPHQAMVGEDAIWNHALPAGTSFAMYPQSSLTGTIDPVPNKVSLKCLGCHDGVTGIDSYGGVTGTLNFGPGDDENVGQDLSNDHPISVDYDLSYHGGNGLVDPTGFYFGPGSPYLYNNKVECGSCHFVHGGGFAGKLLRMPIGGSALCLGCHNE